MQIINSFLFNISLGFYLILALQWYSYKFKRIIFHYHNFYLHLYFIIVPCLIFISLIAFNQIILLIYLLINCLGLIFWHKKLDKKLVFTKKVIVFFIILIILSAIFSYLALSYSLYFLTPTLPLSFILLKIYDILLNAYYKKRARKIYIFKDLQIILITASFGKTSIKNFLYELLKDDFLVQKTPRSVNTLLGIIKDINENLKPDTQIYIVEAGARLKGDILEITKFLNPHFCIIGEIGKAHLEYFKSVENIRKTKLEALQSKRLKKAFVHSSTKLSEGENIIIYDTKLTKANSSLESLEFSMIIDKIYHFTSHILGTFNAQNLCACICCAKELGLNIINLSEKISKLNPVEHRLQVIAKNPKFIIDDGFNGNFAGMSESYRMCKDYNKGQRVLVTPGIIEVEEEENIRLCKIINECFDMAIISARINAGIFKQHLNIKNIILNDKSELVPTLATQTKENDLILFSNDAPNYL
ncbi:UDP-N-acetylmuramoyl-tripeptide--D-alanyl-D-alanine ligase [Campylobacter sp. LR264d]|uniref:Mur ligase family protein n=1 Tax=Campylobacter sp. LR264d TaxID=2593544 RepID=UPI00123B2BF6|nr:UDP-N-acetylmuramoyl-tripeptide--D-alanyl-D-alanine ligase [Campylobacter sp. LR264d]KAA6229481.1 UDP-N-acetylmuramoyl-tripeptide--D-alanyl-D-alanine ligase [Campylobacter sp. LR264d]